MRRRGGQALVASPVIVGTVTLLLTIVAVFLSYNANNGLPFLPTTQLKLQLANGANTFKGVEVREGGFRVGVVDQVRAAKLPNGRVGAELSLRLTSDAGDIPLDSRFSVRLKSAVGLKYVELDRGQSKRTYRDGATVPVSRTAIPVEFDDVLDTFNRPTRVGVQRTLDGLGNAVAGRGSDLNVTVSRLPALLRVVEPVMANLADPGTHLARAVRELGDAARIVAPVADVQARLFTTGADTFAALSSDPAALRQTVEKSPRTLAVGERSLRASRPFLDHLASVSRPLTTATGELRGSLPALIQAVESGTPVTRRSVDLSRRLGALLGDADQLVSDSSTGVALRALTATVRTLQPQIRFLGPQVTVCNTVSLFGTFVADTLSSADPTGSAERGLVQFSDSQDEDVSQMGANEFVTGRGLKNPGGVPQHLHSDDFGDAVDSKGNADCVNGQGGYLWSANKNDDTANHFYRRAVVDPFMDPEGNGPLYKLFDRQGKGHGVGLRRVPKGMTFTRDPGGRRAPEPRR